MSAQRRRGAGAALAMSPLALALLACCLHAANADFAFASFSVADAPEASLRLVGVANRTGDRLRLTPPLSGAAGAVWHAAPQGVAAGFTTEFAFRLFLDTPDQVAGPCRVADHAPDACARRGGDGFALVLHTGGPAALGGGGAGLGYAGLEDGLALEFDTWADASAADPGDNHVALLTRGNATLRSDHGSALGAALTIPDLGDGARHVARVTYSPRFAAEAALSPGFRAAPHLGSLIYPRGSAWRHGLGTLSVWVDALGGPPALVVPIPPLEVLLPRMAAAGVTLGFTAATGAALQAHELLSWALWVDADAPPVALQPGAGCACAFARGSRGQCDAQGDSACGAGGAMGG